VWKQSELIPEQKGAWKFQKNLIVWKPDNSQYHRYYPTAFQKNLIVWKLPLHPDNRLHNFPFQKNLIVWKPVKLRSIIDLFTFVSEELNSVETLITSSCLILLIIVSEELNSVETWSSIYGF